MNTLYFSLKYRYIFKLLYPDNGNIYNIWSQDCNPVIETCAGTGDFVYTPIEIGLPSVGAGGFAGLLTSGSSTYLDGNKGDNWWYAVRNLISPLLTLSLYIIALRGQPYSLTNNRLAQGRIIAEHVRIFQSAFILTSLQ